MIPPYDEVIDPVSVPALASAVAAVVAVSFTVAIGGVLFGVGDTTATCLADSAEVQGRQQQEALEELRRVEPTDDGWTSPTTAAHDCGEGLA